MKRYVLLFFCLIPILLSAGAVDNNSNYSAAYVRMLNRNAAVDDTDIVFYNPAGLASLTDGLYIGLGNQFLIKEYAHEYDDPTDDHDTTWKDNEPIFLLPDIQAVFKHKNWASYLGFYIPAGGGSLKYDDGTFLNLAAAAAYKKQNDIQKVIQFLNASAEGSSIYYGITGGSAVKINDLISLSAGFRFIITETTSHIWVPNSRTLLRYVGRSFGVGGIFGVNIRPVDGMVIAARYETNTPLMWEATKSWGYSVAMSLAGLAPEGEKYRRDLPPILGTGISYAFTPAVRAHINYNFYINKAADWDSKQDQHDNGHEVGAALEYAPLDMLTVSTGIQYTSPGADKKTYYALKPALNALTFAGGVRIALFDRLVANTGVAYAYYFPGTRTYEIEGGSMELDLRKRNIMISLGAEYRFF